MKPTLIILAAGLGSRYGGLKQLDAFLPSNKTIIEYSIYDAYKAGFEKFVIVIKEENKQAVQSMIQHSFDESFDITYVNQQKIVERNKPLGTAHALFCCKEVVKGPAGIINGDDFYGYDAFCKLYAFLSKDVSDKKYGMISYLLENTLSKFGGVSRGICTTLDGKLESVHECTGIQWKNNQMINDEGLQLTKDQLVSMNMWGFDQCIFHHIERFLKQFLETDYKQNPEKSEFYLPFVFDQLIKENKIEVEVIKTHAKWYGVTYQEDKQEVIEGIGHLLNQYQMDLKWWNLKRKEIMDICQRFQIKGEVVQVLMNATGNINDTYQIVTNQANYLFQRINHMIFKDVDGLMNNMSKITCHLQNKDKKTLHIIPTLDHHLYYQENNQYYRMFDYIENSFTYDASKSIHDFYQTAVCFGEFFKDLNDFDSSKLIESIPDFHCTPKRYDAFIQVLQDGNSQRIEETQDEINKIMSRSALKDSLYQLYHDGKIKLRVCHNDTKLSNILMDEITKSPICVIDFDTIMPGFIGYDYGDALRSGANHTYEDNEYLEEVYFDLEMFEAFTKGFLEVLKDTLSDEEIASLVEGLKVIVYEQAIRFLMDYLQNDSYYKIKYPTHNLVRARNQIRLLEDIELKEASLYEIINKYK